MNNTTNKKAVIYCRVSTKEQVEEGNSLQTQEKICRDYAIKNGYEIVEVFIEQGESAKTAQRTELQRLLSYCAVRRNGISAIIAYKIDRISRNTDDYSQIRILLKRYGVEIKSTSEYFENTPAGRFMENIIANVAQFDNDVRTERSVGGMRDAMREGRYVWLPPLGYVNTKIAGKSTIAPDHLAPLIRRSFELMATGLHSIDEVHRMVTKEGLLTRSGKPTNKSHFHKLIRHEIYAGWITKFGERHKGTFDPIISEALFDTVQHNLKKRKRTMGHYQMESPDFPLRRFVKDIDGNLLTGGWSKGRARRYPYYRFSNQSKGFQKTVIEYSFVSFFNQFSLNEKHYAEFENLLQENLMKGTEAKQRNITQLNTLIKGLKEKQDLLIEKNLQGSKYMTKL